MQLEAVIVSVNYGDFLAETLPRNLAHFNRAVVVTASHDRETIALCRKYGVAHLETTYHVEDGDKFNKGRLINLGISNLGHNDWLLQLDADIILPDRFRHMLGLARLSEDCLYGADRFNCYSPEDLAKAD